MLYTPAMPKTTDVQKIDKSILYLYPWISYNKHFALKQV